MWFHFEVLMFRRFNVSHLTKEKRKYSNPIGFLLVSEYKIISI